MALGNQGGRGVAHQHPTGVHQRDAVATLGLVHEMGGDEDRHPVVARQIDHQLPEQIAGHGIDPGGRFVKNQQLGFMDHGHGQGQTLAVAERQLFRQAVLNLAQAEPLDHLVHPRRNVGFDELEQPRVQHQILAHREFAIQRKRLRHVAHAPAGVEVGAVDRLAKQPGLPFACRQQAGEHLHGG